jgi:hypothetical protein
MKAGSANPMERLVGSFEFKFERGDFAKLRSEFVERKPYIEQRADKHVAADSTDQVAVGYSH